MKTGVTLTDDKGRALTVGKALGRGLWGSSWVVRSDTGAEMVMKLAHEQADFPADATLPEGLVDACRACHAEQVALLRDPPAPWLPRLEGAFTTPEGTPALLLPRYTTTLAQRMARGLGPVIAALVAATRLLEAQEGRQHGNLRPSNLLFTERGDPVLTDPLTPTAAAWWRRLAALTPGRADLHPPEASTTVDPVWDTWGLCAILFQAALHSPPTGDRRSDPPPPPPRQGLDKVALADLKDRALARLKGEGANPRFTARVADRLATLLNRGLSLQAEPSPPYRFAQVGALRPRLEELDSLVHPRVDSVGKVLLGAAAVDDVFQGDHDVSFSISVGATAGGHEDLAAGLKVIDLDEGEDGRISVADSRYTVKTHPSGRMRFDFTLPGIPPGRYRVAVAFAVRDSGDEPLAATAEFEVRPPPGYVPPAEEPLPQPVALELPSKRAPVDPPTTPVSTDPGLEDNVFPLPIAPSTPGTLEEPSTPDVPSIPSDEAGPPTPPPTPPPPPHPLHTPPPSLGKPRGVDDDTTRPSMEWSGPGEWESLPGPEDDALFPDEGMIPSQADTQDLPTWEEPAATTTRGLPELVERAVTFVRKDTYTAFMAGIGSLLVFVVLLFVLVRSCS